MTRWPEFIALGSNPVIILSHPFGKQSCHHPVSPFWESILSSSCLTLLGNNPVIILSHPFGNQSCHHPVSPFWEAIQSSSSLTLLGSNPVIILSHTFSTPGHFSSHVL